MLYQRLVQDEKLRKLLASYFLVLIFTLMLSKIFSEALSLSDKHNYKTFTKFPPGSLLHCIENIFNIYLGSGVILGLTMAAQSFTKSTGHLFIYSFILLSSSVIISYRKKMIPIPLLVFHLLQAFGTRALVQQRLFCFVKQLCLFQIH